MDGETGMRAAPPADDAGWRAAPGQFRVSGTDVPVEGAAGEIVAPICVAGDPGLAARALTRGATTPIEMMYLSASSTVMSSSRTLRARQHHEIAAGRIGRRRHVDAHVLARQMWCHRRGGRPGLERDRPAPRAREFDQQRLAKRVALFRQQGVADLLDRRVDRLDERDAAEQRFPHPRMSALRRRNSRRRRRSRAGSRSATTTPKPGNVESEQRVAAAGSAGSSSSDLVDRGHAAQWTTQIVMPSGTQTSRPAIR